VSKIDEKQYPVDHRITQRDEGIKASPLEGVNDILNEHGEGQFCYLLKRKKSGGSLPPTCLRSLEGFI
jgi:hypothetical protein